MHSDGIQSAIKSRCDRVLLALLGSQDLVDGWWTSPNRAFDGETPLQTLDKNHHRVVNYLLAQLNGDYS